MEKKLYTEEQVEQMKKDVINEKIIQFAKQMNSTISNNFVTAQKKNLFTTKFTQDNVKKYLENSQKYEKELRSLSLMLSTISPQYQQIMNYIPGMATFIPVVTPNVDKFSDSKGSVSDVEKLRKDYLKCVNHLDIMNIQHEFQKILAVMTREDIFAGYIYETKDSFYIQQLDADYVRITTISDGCFNISFSFDYFDKNNKLKDVEGNLIDNYPLEFQTKYKIYQNDKQNMKWQELNEENTIVLKFNETLPFCFPPYCNTFFDLVDLSTYKEMIKNSTELETYKMIGLELPLSNKADKADDFLVSVETALSFFSMINSNLPSGVSSFISATPFKSIDFSGSNVNDKNKILEAENNVFASAGISPICFGRNTNNSGAMKYSTMVDESLIFRIYRQFERWLNRRFKRMYNGKFSIKLIDVTTFSINEAIDRELKLAQYGVPNKLTLASLVGISQNKERGTTLLEEVLDIGNTWKPLSSSHTQSSTEEVGRPQSEDTELSDSGETTRRNDSNSNR